MSWIITCLANADATDLSSTDWVVVLIDVAIVIIVCGMVCVPIACAARRRHKLAEMIVSGAILWGLVLAGSALWMVNAEFKWSHERGILLQSGYYDPQNNSGAPVWPWWLWGVLAVVYGVLVGISLRKKKTS